MSRDCCPQTQDYQPIVIKLHSQKENRRAFRITEEWSILRNSFRECCQSDKVIDA